MIIRCSFLRNRLMCSRACCESSIANPIAAVPESAGQPTRWPMVTSSSRPEFIFSYPCAADNRIMPPGCRMTCRAIHNVEEDLYHRADRETLEGNPGDRMPGLAGGNQHGGRGYDPRTPSRQSDAPEGCDR